MKKRTVIIISIILSISVIITGGIIYFVNTPQYALMKIIDDVEASGIEGLKPHLTGNAKKTIDAISEISENRLVNAIFEKFDDGELIRILKEKMQETDWELQDILKSKNKATVIVAFNYDEKLVGTIKLNLIRKNGWKIDSLDFPEFERIHLK